MSIAAAITVAALASLAIGWWHGRRYERERQAPHDPRTVFEQTLDAMPAAADLLLTPAGGAS